MRKTYLFNVIMLCAMMASVMFTSCADRMEEVKPGNAEDQVPEEVVARLQKLGFNTEGIKLKDNGYLVEGDMIITPEAFAEMGEPASIPGLPVGEHYRSYNLVTNNRTIRVMGVGLNSTLNTALDWALASYNSLIIGLNFVRVSSGADITITASGSYAGASSGFPSNGNPYPNITIGGGTSNYGTRVCEHVIKHEIGHCIGMAHTDANSFSACGGTGNGIIYIPGTPTSDPASVFNSCYSGSSNGSFSIGDKIALQYLY